MRVLALGAHFDDVELGCGGTIARHVENGDTVIIFVATHSGYSDHAGRVIRKPEIALAEGQAAAEILGASDLICADYPTNQLEFNDGLMCSLLKVIEPYKPSIIYTHWDGDVHHDHRSLARASLAAARHIPRLLMYRSNYYDGEKPFMGNFYVDVTTTLEKKKKAIKAHESEYQRAGEKWLRFFLNQHENDGYKIGVKYAESFHLVKYLV